MYLPNSVWHQPKHSSDFILKSIVLFLTFGLFLSNIHAASAANYTKSQLQQMVSPIALYPDQLLQVILPAATFPDQVTDASLLIRSKRDAELISEQDWDASVKVVATYPGVLKMMFEKLDWITLLGEAFIGQPNDVMAAIQDLRAKAKSLGNLKSTPEQTVAQSNSGGTSVITIQPSNPEVIYIPQQTTTVVYTQPVQNPVNFWTPVVTFGLGMAIGSAMNNNNDNYYYGSPWHGSIWHSNESFNNWNDRRYDSIDNAVNQRNDTVNHALDNRKDLNEDRHDRAFDRQDTRQDYAKNNSGTISKDTWKNSSAQRQQQLSNARSNYNSAGTRSATTARTTASSGGWSGSGGSGYANTAQSRGSASRASGGFSRGSGGGGMRAGGSRGGGRR